jgi:flagellar biosynthesis/type III secretory pathway protein FliH
LILRNATLSSQRHRLGLVETPRLESRPEPLRPTLTVGEVCAWLVGEGEAARRACASQLAPELDKLRATAREEGYADGQEAARREVEKRHAEALEHLARVVRAFEVAREKVTDELTNTCASVVAEAFAKLAGEFLVTPAATLGAVRSVLSRVRDGRHYTVYVHPSALSAIEAQRDDLQAAIGNATLEVQGDDALSGGGCRVGSDLGTIDAAFEVQLQALFETLRTAHVTQRVAPR